MAVHILRSGVRDNVCSPLKRIAVNRGGKGIVHNEGHLMSMGRLRKFFDIQHHQGRIGYRFRQNTFGIILKRFAQSIVIRIRIHYGTGNAHFFHGHCDEVKGSSIHSR